MSTSYHNRADRIKGRVWVGSKPPCGANLDKYWDTLILAAEEYQPPSNCWNNIDIIYAPLNDAGYPMTDKERTIARLAGEVVADKIRKGECILSTCQAGLNRSSLIASLGILYSGIETDPNEIVYRVKLARSPAALSNRQFDRFLRQEASRIYDTR